ncbi:MAG: sensor histidine kinase, partial [Blastocatellia bacterium]
TNAEQAMKAQDRRGALTVKTEEVSREGGRWVRVAISDTGPGIPSEILANVFDPFFTTKGVGEGTGLGLSISYGIIKQHGGDITAYSDSGLGASFVVELPCKGTEAETLHASNKPEDASAATLPSSRT